MKNTEAMERAPKSTELAAANGETSGSGMPLLADQRRRRLVRGAAAFAPVVLTLRSGALAAASCTGVKIQGRTIDKHAKILDTTNVVGPTPGPADICAQFDPNAPTQCVGNKVPTTTPPLKYAQVTQNGGNFYCGPKDGAPFGTGNVSQTVAILSSQSATSMRL